MKNKKRRIRGYVGRIFVITGILALVALTAFDLYIKPTLVRLISYQCQLAAERIISNAVFGHVGDELNSYNDIVSFTFDNNGRISALNTDQNKINSLKSLINESINNEIDSISDETVGISIGSLSGISYFYGMGKELQFHVEPKGKADTKLVSKFKSAGINQTIHSIVLEVSVALTPVIAGFGEEVKVDTNLIISQTVLIGEVPDSYSNIILDEEYYSELADFDL
ncbi:MAG: sporulation protein YunB [Ruminiclostridium sp.]